MVSQMAHAKKLGEPFMAHLENLYNIPCTDTQVSEHYIYLSLQNILVCIMTCDLYNDQQYTVVHCLAVKLSFILWLECKNVTVI